MRPWLIVVRAVATAIVTTLLVAGSASAGSVATRLPVGTGNHAAAPACPALPTDAVTLSTFVFDGATSRAAAAALACFGRREVTVDVYVPRDVGIDAPWFPQVEPAWLSPYGLPQAVVQASRTSTGFGVRVPPRLQRCVDPTPTTFPGCPFADVGGQFVRMTGHFDDLAARTCRFVSPPPAGRPTPAELVTSCRQEFVIDSVTAIGQSPPATDTVGPPSTGSPTPSRSPALGLAVVLIALTLLVLRPLRH